MPLSTMKLKVHFKIRSKNTKLVSRFNELGFKVNYEYKNLNLNNSLSLQVATKK